MTNLTPDNQDPKPLPESMSAEHAETVPQGASNDAEAIDAENLAVVAESSESHQMNQGVVDIEIRRAPKYPVFIVLGAIIGLTISTILTYSFPEVQGKSTWSQVFGYLFLPAVAFGGALGGVVALVLDRISRSKNRVKTGTAEQTSIHDDNAPSF